MQKQPTHLTVHHLSLPPSGTPIRDDLDILDLEHNKRDETDTQPPTIKTRKPNVRRLPWPWGCEGDKERKYKWTSCMKFTSRTDFSVTFGFQFAYSQCFWTLNVNLFQEGPSKSILGE